MRVEAIGNAKNYLTVENMLIDRFIEKEGPLDIIFHALEIGVDFCRVLGTQKVINAQTFD